MDNDDPRVPYSKIRHAEWIMYRWSEVTEFGDSEPMFLRGYLRPLDEAMRLAGGSIKDLEPYLWAAQGIGLESVKD